MSTDDKYIIDATVAAYLAAGGVNENGSAYERVRALLGGTVYATMPQPETDADRAALAILQPPADHKPYDASAAARLEASMVDAYDADGERRRLADWEHESRRIAERLARLGTDKRGKR